MTLLKTVLEIEGYKIKFNFIKGCPATNNDLKLSELNRSDEILKAAVDREYQKKLLKEFGL